ncbi:transglycosylase domain-containing protein, partial [Achromobacter denitrificans]
VVAADGTPLRNYPSRDGIWRYPVKPDQVSERYLETLLTYEDRWFYWHPGVNPVALARAGWQWATNRRIVSGGSTLTMQVARLIDPQLAGKPSRTMSAKLRQAWRAVQLEMHYSKDEILSLYLTHAPMGGIVEGVEMGSRLWLGKPARDLSPAEAAMLTALPQ